MTTQKTYTIGVDFGALSAQAVLVDVSNGNLISSFEYQYPHGLISEKLPNSEILLPPGWALHHPQDYLNALVRAIPKLLREGDIQADQVIGVGIDFKGSTLIPTTADGTPLAMIEAYKDEPHAWPKTWKHIAAREKAAKLTQLASDRFETFLDRYGGQINAEWFFPKVWELYDDNSSLYNTADRLIEAADWLVWQLTGIETRNLCAAGYKGLWSKSEGFPLETFFASLDPGLANVIEDKMKRDIIKIGEQAGELTEEAAKMLHLTPGTPVASGMLSPYTAAPAASVAEPGKMVLILGSSFELLVLAKKEYRVPGMSGMVEDSLVPGLVGYEAEQAGGGNHFEWFIKNGVPSDYERLARKQKISPFKLMDQRAAELLPGESGLVCLDWWNGNRSILADRDLTGLILGYSLDTTPEEIYRAIIEATTFGTRKIFETFIASGVPINEIIVAGGKTIQNELLLEVLANVSRMEIKVTETPHTSALGSAMYAAVASGEGRGGYGTIQEAAQKMAHLSKKTYIPNNNDKKTYNRLYSEYTLLHDYFGYGHNNAMKRLNAIRNTILDKKKRQ